MPIFFVKILLRLYGYVDWLARLPRSRQGGLEVKSHINTPARLRGWTFFSSNTHGGSDKGERGVRYSCLFLGFSRSKTTSYSCCSKNTRVLTITAKEETKQNQKTKE